MHHWLTLGSAQFGFQDHQRRRTLQSLEIFGGVSRTIVALAILVERSRSWLRGEKAGSGRTGRLHCFLGTSDVLCCRTLLSWVNCINRSREAIFQNFPRSLHFQCIRRAFSASPAWARILIAWKALRISVHLFWAHFVDEKWSFSDEPSCTIWPFNWRIRNDRWPMGSVWGHELCMFVGHLFHLE